MIIYFLLKQVNMLIHFIHLIDNYQWVVSEEETKSQKPKIKPPKADLMKTLVSNSVRRKTVECLNPRTHAKNQTSQNCHKSSKCYCMQSPSEERRDASQLRGRSQQASSFHCTNSSAHFQHLIVIVRTTFFNILNIHIHPIILACFPSCSSMPQFFSLSQLQPFPCWSCSRTRNLPPVSLWPAEEGALWLQWSYGWLRQPPLDWRRH